MAIAPQNNPQNNQVQSVKERAELVGRQIGLYTDDLRAILPPHVSMDRLKQMFVLQCKKTPKLLDCDPVSLIQAVFTCASMGLAPDPYLGQVYILPYGKQAQVIPGYKGLAQLIRNSDEIASISTGAIHQNDEYEYQLGSDPKLVHKPALTNRGDIIIFYCTAKFKDGSVHIEIMTREEVELIRDNSANYSRSNNKASTVWGQYFEEMGKKTVFRRIAKWLPMSTTREFRNALAVDNAVFEGKSISVDTETGEVIEIWQDENEVPTESTRLEALVSQEVQV